MSEQTDTPKETLYYDQRSVALRTAQSVYFVEEHDKISMIDVLLNEYKSTQTIIVVKSKKTADILSEFLISQNLNATAIHGNHREVQQKEVATKFNLGTLNILITTDMILKTLELENIKLILSHDLPNNAQEYYNRLALMKEKGISMAFISPEDKVLLSDIEYNMKAEIEVKILEGFESTATPRVTTKKDRKKKPRHRKSRVRKVKDL